MRVFAVAGDGEEGDHLGWQAPDGALWLRAGKALWRFEDDEGPFDPEQPPVWTGHGLPQDLLFADDGAVWTRIAVDDGSGDATWVVVESDGGVRGRLALPPTLNPLWARDEVLWASIIDELDVPWLVQYQIGPLTPRDGR